MAFGIDCQSPLHFILRDFKISDGEDDENVISKFIFARMRREFFANKPFRSRCTMWAK